MRRNKNILLVVALLFCINHNISVFGQSKVDSLFQNHFELLREIVVSDTIKTTIPSGETSLFLLMLFCISDFNFINHTGPAFWLSMNRIELNEVENWYQQNRGNFNQDKIFGFLQYFRNYSFVARDFSELEEFWRQQDAKLDSLMKLDTFIFKDQ